MSTLIDNFFLFWFFYVFRQISWLIFQKEGFVFVHIMYFSAFFDYFWNFGATQWIFLTEELLKNIFFFLLVNILFLSTFFGNSFQCSSQKNSYLLWTFFVITQFMSLNLFCYFNRQYVLYYVSKCNLEIRKLM